MERWAANTLRGLGILVTAVLMIAACLLLLLMSMCTWKSNSAQPVGYLIGAVFVLALGIFIIARLARGVIRSSEPQSTSVQGYDPGVPVHISPASAEALDHLSYAIGASIAFGVLLWGIALYRLSAGHLIAPDGAFSSLHRPLLIVSLITAAIHYVPYVLVLFRLQRNPNRPALAFAMGIPAASILHSVTSLPLMWRVFSYPQYFVQSLLPMTIAFLLQIVILVLAYRANHRLGYRQEPVSLIVATAAAYVYFMIFASSNTWMYRLIH